VRSVHVDGAAATAELALNASAPPVIAALSAKRRARAKPEPFGISTSQSV
jgi:hypothetical protein